MDEIVTEDLNARWNVAPSLEVYAVTTSKDGSIRRLEALRWGLIPSWAKDPSVGNRMINARAESLLTRPAYRRAVATRRCIIPADGFYEWKRVDRGTATKRSTPYYLRSRRGQRLGFAGLWEVWHDAEGMPLRSCTIVTTEANQTVEPIHDRMPVILDPACWGEWLAPVPLEGDELMRLLVPAPSDLLEVIQVGVGVNRPGNEGPELIEPVRPDGS